MSDAVVCNFLGGHALHCIWCGAPNPEHMMTLEEALKEYAASGPVNIPGPQAKAARAWTFLKPHLLAHEVSELQSARGHSIDVGLGRSEFDWVMAKVRKRLGL